MKFKDLTNKRFGKLVVISFSCFNKSHHAQWLCKCDCGKEKVIGSDNLQNGNIKSCGCLRGKLKKLNIDLSIYHKFYRCWRNILSRCNNSKHPRYNLWGGRGIQCEWKSFQEFYNDMYVSYSAHNTLFGGRNTTIERINNDGNYSLTNCCWATQREQSNNKRHWSGKKTIS